MGSTQRDTLTPQAALGPLSSKSARGIPRPMVQDARAAESMPTIRFTNLADLLRAIAAAPGDALRVTDVSPTVFKRLDEDYERHRIRLSMYTEDTRCLIITITTGAHEVAHRRLNKEAVSQIDRMGLDANWEDYGNKTFYFERRRPGDGGGGGGGGGGKQADSCGKPVPERRRGFPTLVIESGYSQTLPATINITETSTTPPTYQVASSDLVLDFRLLFLRNPRQGEGDVVITVAWLQQYAQRVWEAYDEEME
ncbi:hypothetical protein TrVFT333_008774 [Trichoderma virens FT-333]|nr:hypothetical protein TrVFT333_008774 [Trichoderma virens FT-333]